MPKKDITLIISSLNAGGAEKAISELANYWVQQGYAITIVTLAAPEQKPFYPLDKSVCLIQLDKTSRKSLYIYLKDIVGRFFALRQTIKKLKPDLIVSFIDIMNVTTLISCWGMKIPIIVSERIDPAYHHIYKLCSWLRRKTYPYAKYVVVQTASAAAYFPELSTVKIIPNAVKHPVQFIKLNRQVKHIVTIGRLDKQKDHQTLIRAFAALDADLTLTIYGQGPERHNLEKLIADLKLTNKVKMPGVTKDVYKALCGADLFVFPSKYEGFPNALCEAMAIGLPVIASSCSGNVDIVEDKVNGRLFAIGDVGGLTKILAELINDPEQRAKLSENAKQVAVKFSERPVYKLWDEVLS